MRQRRNRTFSVLFPWLLIAVWATAAPAAVINYSITDLGAYPVGMVPFASSNSVNFSGQGIFGNVIVQAGGSSTEIPLDLGDALEGRAINDAGLMVGRLMDYDPAVGRVVPRAYAWSIANGLEFLGPAYSEARNVNEKGWIVGDFLAGGSERRGALWVPNGSSYELRELLGGSGQVFGRAVSESGIVTGTLLRTSNGPVAFTWDSSARLFQQAGGMHGFAVNDFGQVAGRTKIGGNWSSFFWDPVTGSDLFGGSPSWGLGVNNSGQAVGFHDPLSVPVEHDSPIYFDIAGNTADFESLGIPNMKAVKINELGQIVGLAEASDGWHAVRWDPPGLGQQVPEPSALWLLVLGLLSFGAIRFRLFW